ncbi:condensation domain-containing protein [Vibrio nigripulchritudo]|uniref:condensation domain-containing protein n=1 Tax=Vibrio nigripulchritudo TaxID=28173 RepID=UPI00248F6A46|nr:condensation domain-containing protein [Vibrio nigripulchritudo]BDU39736.1 hypothetical protein TUMSATVNIG2_42050 [Vibrio nigripulchritudo]BDU45459.1 hypothetical protein TUMSATVNIG3_42570 [Vibrio nigripulchritudo]
MKSISLPYDFEFCLEVPIEYADVSAFGYPRVQVSEYQTPSMYREYKECRPPIWLEPDPSFSGYSSAPTYPIEQPSAVINTSYNPVSLPEPKFEPKNNLDDLTSSEKQLLSKACSVLQLASLSIDDDFVEQGGDSISAVTLSVELESIGMKLDTMDIMKYRVFSEMSQHIKQETHTQILKGENIGDIDLLPAQRWFFEQDFMQPNHYNHAATIALPEDISCVRLEQALIRLTEHHDIFRSRFNHFHETSRQTFIESTEGLISFAEESFANQDECDIYLANLNESFELDSGEGVMFKAVLYRFRSECRALLYMCAHHLIVDATSWKVIARDLQSLYEGDCETRLPQYSGVQIYAQTLNAQLEKICKNETSYWLKSDSFSPKCRSSFPARVETITIDERVTAQLLDQANKPYNTRPNELLLTALSNLLSDRGEHIEVLMESEGRQNLASNIKVDATVGWFASVYPLDLPSTKSHASQQIKRVKEAVRNVPNNGANYLHLAYHHPDSGVKRRLQNRLNAPISFKYHDDYPSGDSEVWPLLINKQECLVNERNKALREIEINCWIQDQKLHIQVEVTSLKINLTSMILNFADEVRSIVSHCTDKRTVPALTPSDLTNLDLTQQHIEAIENKIGTLSAIYPATHFQRELLYFHRLNRDYQIDQVYYQIGGDLNLNAFEKAWDIALARHDILRAVFCDAFDRGSPIVIVPEVSKMRIVHEDWSHLSAESQQEELEERLISERRKEINELSSPLMRLWLGDLGGHRHTMIFTFHHVLFDRWSMQTFLSEIMRDYDALVQGLSPSIYPMSFEPFSHYISDYQNDSKAKSFWRNYLRNAPKNFRLPRSNTTFNEVPTRIQNVNMQLTDIETGQIAARARAYNVTTNQFCQLCWAHTLSKVTGKQDVVFGTTLAKRPSSIHAITHMVGLFLATPPVRVNVSGNIAFALSNLVENSANRLEYGFFDLNEYDEDWKPVAPFGTLFVFDNYPDQENHPTSKMLSLEKLGTVSGTNHQLVLCVTPGHAMSYTLFFDGTEISEEVANLVANEFLSSMLTLCETDSLNVGSTGSDTRMFQ